MTLFNGTCNNCIYEDGKPITCNECGGVLRGGLCLPCNLKPENSFNCYQDAYSFNDPSNNSNYLPQPQYENYLCNLCGNNSHDGYDCQQQFPFIYEQEPSYNQNYDGNYYPYNLPSFPCCDNCGGSHETFQCQTMAQNIDFSGSDQIQTPRYPDVHPPSQEYSNEFLCIHDNVDDLIESALNTKLLSINSQHLDKKEQEVKNVVEQPAERGNRIEKSLQNFRIIQKRSISLNYTSQISSGHAIAPILSTKEPEHPLSMGYEHLSITPETESDEVTESNAKNLLPIPSECEVTLEDKRECDVPISKNSPTCDDHSEILFDSNNDDDISVYDDFEDVEYVEASISDPEIVSVEEENVVQQEEEEIDLEDISQIQDVVPREKLLSITPLIFNIESLNDNLTPDLVLNSFVSIPTFEESNNSLSNTFSPEFEIFCDHMEETRSEANLFLAYDNSIPPGIENVANDPEGDIRFLEELIIDDSILFHESSDSNFEDNPSIPRPPLEPPDAKTDAEEIPVVMNDKDKFDEDYYFVMFDKVFSLLSAKSEDTIFDPDISA
uniref:Pre-mRNA splicing Prp18-interacting factor n=1 Tax=Tanacetum cinerariifolium TaxID=118510 RepID=A0A6L2KAG3_TANCI|nr:hypothetical protein [Tanacetum cinerariifolium]